MKKMYKIFGAVAIIGLFLLSSVASTSMAITEDPEPETSTEIEPDFELSTEPGDGEPEGIIPADLFITDVGKRIGGQVYVTVVNQGMGIAWLPYRIHIYVAGLANPEDDILCFFGPRLPGAATTYHSKLFVGGTLPRYTRVIVDYTNNIFEGIFGENNNVWTGYL